MATTTAHGEDYLSQHFANTQRARLPSDEKSASVVYTTTDQPKSSRPMSMARKISAVIITLSHLFSLWALYDMLFVAEFAQGLKWFAAATIMYYITGIQGITAGVHRLWAHRSYTANFPTRVWLMCMNSIANQASIITWATEHRIHHLHVDTDADPHNANRGLFFAHIGWLYSRRTDAFAAAKKEVDVADLYADPVANFQDKYYPIVSVWFCFIMPTLMGLYFGGSAWRGFLYLANLRWIMNLHVTWNVNSLAHFYGDRPYDPNQKASEHLFTSILSGGEGWHNFHHTVATDYRGCEQESMWRWNDPSGIDWRFNGARFFIDLYAALGGVSDRRVLRVKQITH